MTDLAKSEASFTGVAWWVTRDYSRIELDERGEVVTWGVGFHDQTTVDDKDNPFGFRIGDVVYLFDCGAPSVLRAWGYVTDVPPPRGIVGAPHPNLLAYSVVFTIDSTLEADGPVTRPQFSGDPSLTPTQLSPVDATELVLELRDSGCDWPRGESTTHVFVSYAREDAAFVGKLTEEIEQRSLQVWVDDRIEYGSTWADAINYAIDRCACCVVVMSPAAGGSEWVAREIARAQCGGKMLFPVLLSGEPLNSLETLQHVDARDGAVIPDQWFETIKLAVACSRPFVLRSP